MRKPVADILSSVIYNSKVITPDHLDCRVNECLQWVNVRGQEEMMDGSKINHQEAEAIFNLLNTMIASRKVDRLNVVVTTG